MKDLKTRFVKAVCYTSVFLFSFLVPLASTHAQEQPSGKIMSLVGKAQIFENNQWKNLQTGSPVFANSSIQTGYNSKVIVLFRNGGQRQLGRSRTRQRLGEFFYTKS